MKLSELKTSLESLASLSFKLPNGEFIPSHFHVTELGFITKKYIDCGGTVRVENYINLQIWYANDVKHRLPANKLLQIIAVAEKKLSIGDAEIEVEYQGNTIEKYGLSFNQGIFNLTNNYTDCLAKDKCGISQGDLNQNNKSGSCCSSNQSCC